MEENIFTEEYKAKMKREDDLPRQILGLILDQYPEGISAQEVETVLDRAKRQFFRITFKFKS